jgi:predicted DCC family thiol-disulfide oxidoreductase YuxK
MLNLTNSNNFREGALDMNVVLDACQESLSFTIVCDERCTIVRNFGALIKCWDKRHTFVFVDRDSSNQRATELIQRLDRSKWSLLLIDENGSQWEGPEAVPIILKNLPFGKIAAVLYILPGTMWLTRQFYLLVSRSKSRLTPTEQRA